MPRPQARRHASLSFLVTLFLLAPGLSAAGPAPEYAPEAEAGFLVRCAGPDVMSDAAAACRRLMESLQATLGYEAFLERAAEGPRSFAAASDRRLAVVAPIPQAQ